MLFALALELFPLLRQLLNDNAKLAVVLRLPVRVSNIIALVHV